MVGGHADEICHDLPLAVARVGDAGVVLARDLPEVVNSRRQEEADLLPHGAVADVLQRAPGGHRRELLQRLPAPSAQVEVGHGDEPARRVGVRAPPDALAAGAMQPQDRPHHVHDAPNLLFALALGEVLDDDAVPDGHEPRLRAAPRARVGVGARRDLLHEVLGGCALELPGRPRALEVVAEEAAEHAEEDDAREVAVLRLPVPAVEVRVVQPVGQHGVSRIAGQRVEELRALGQLAHEVLLHRHRLAQLALLVEHLLAHALQLQPREVPDLRDLRLRQVLLDRCELSDDEARNLHPVLVVLRQCQLSGGDQVHLDGIVDLEAVDLGVNGSAMKQVADKRQVDVLSVPPLDLQEAVLVQQLLRRVLVPAIASIDK
mmetsp:Transcript_91548/g.255760  ORF Transcript_91548/g.255760 Transcript_91548/m.255760 type:complete len:375 (-) Transcript_91548:534-1658(-)